MTTKVRLKFNDKNRSTTTAKITEVAYGQLQIPFTKIFPTSDGFKAICRNEKDADRILQTDAIALFAGIGVSVILPPEIRAKRTIFVRNLDIHIGQHSQDELKQEIEEKNDWAKIEEVIKIKNFTHILKIRFRDTLMADKAMDRGLLAYNMSVTPNQIQRETFVSLLTCFKCYALEDHTTKDCQAQEIMCSECGETGHKWNDCTNQNKACLNCMRSKKEHIYHRTLAMACPIRKELIKNKLETDEQEKQRKQNLTLAQVVKQATNEAKTPINTTHIRLSEEKHTKILISIMHAHVANISKPGTYQTELNNMLKMNNLPQMWFPENPESGKLLQASHTSETTTSATALETQEEMFEHTMTDCPDVNQTDSDILKSSEVTDISNRDPRLMKTQENSHKLEAEDLGLTLYVGSKYPLPTTDISHHDILEAINKGVMKWIYTDREYDENKVHNLLFQGQINIRKSTYKKTDETSFRKIRNGTQDRSPLSQPNRYTKYRR